MIETRLPAFATGLLLRALSHVGTAQAIVPLKRQFVTVMQRIGLTDVAISYSRPRVSGRRVWGTSYYMVRSGW